MDVRLKETLQTVIAFLVVVLSAYWVFTNASLVNELVQGYGLVGLLVAAMIANASIFLPVPIDIVIFAVTGGLSGLPEILLVAVVAGFGAAVGEMTAYLLGLLGVKSLEKAKRKEFAQIAQVREKLGKKGFVFVLLGALTPFPFDLIGITAGLIKYDVKKFFIAALIGKIIRYLLIGLASLYGVPVIVDIFGLG